MDICPKCGLPLQACVTKKKNPVDFQYAIRNQSKLRNRKTEIFIES